jgi:hypothetical protein
MNRGNGTLIWSGMQLANHVQANTNLAESKLFLHLISSIVPIESKPAIIGTVDFKSDRDVDFSAASGGKGILMRYAFWDGWMAEVNGEKQKIYKAGPAYPGFMYIPLSSAASTIAHFTFNGASRVHVIWVISTLILVTLLDLIIFNGFFIGNNFKRLMVYLYKHTRI